MLACGNLRAIVKDQVTFILRLVHEGSTVAYLSGRAYRPGKIDGKGAHAFINHLIVLSAERRRGLGCLLMEALEAYLVAYGPRRSEQAVDLKCQTTNKGSCDFYAALGFKAGKSEEWTSFERRGVGLAQKAREVVIAQRLGS